jgi:hypothetical protein
MTGYFLHSRGTNPGKEAPQFEMEITQYIHHDRRLTSVYTVTIRFGCLNPIISACCITTLLVANYIDSITLSSIYRKDSRYRPILGPPGQ